MSDNNGVGPNTEEKFFPAKVTEPQNGSNDLSQRVKTLVNSNFLESLETLVLQSREHMNELNKHLSDKRDAIMDQVAKELNEILELQQKNSTTLFLKLEKFSERQRARIQIVDTMVDQQAAFADGLQQLFDELFPENKEMQQT